MIVQFDHWLAKTGTDGRAPIFLIAYFDGHRLRISTKEKCLPKQWDAGSQKFRRSLSGYQDANDNIQALAERVQQAYRRLRTAGLAVTPDLLRAALAPVEDTSPPPSPSLVDMFDEYIKSLPGRGFRAYTIRWYGTVRNHLAAWSAELAEPVTVAGYTMSAHEDFLNHLRIGVGLAQNTIASTVKQLKPLLTWARDTRGLALGVDPGKLVVDWEEVNKAWLTAPELAMIERTLLPSSLVRVRDSFLFCCYTGLRYSDLVDLHPGNLHAWDGGTVLRLTQTKTRTAVSIYLTPPALALLAKYDGAHARLLPSAANQVMNRYLKRIARLAGISSPVEVVETLAGRVVKRVVEKWELVTMHTARHTFAVQSLTRGMPITVLQKVLGHSEITTTMIYAKVVEDFQHHEMRRVWGGASAGGGSPEADAGICEVAPAA